MLQRLTSLESALTEANKFAEAERVRCEQTEAVIESLLTCSQMHSDKLAEHARLHRHALMMPRRAAPQLPPQRSRPQTSRGHLHMPLLLTAPPNAQLSTGSASPQARHQPQVSLSRSCYRNQQLQPPLTSRQSGSSHQQLQQERAHTMADPSTAGILMSTAAPPQVPATCISMFDMVT